MFELMLAAAALKNEKTSKQQLVNNSDANNINFNTVLLILGCNLNLTNLTQKKREFRLKYFDA